MRRLVLLLIADAALAAEPPGLARGIDLYERGQFAKSRAALAPVLDSAAADADKNRARLYLAADYFALGDRRAATYALEDLARHAADQTVDPSVFPPDFVALWEEARRGVAPPRSQVPPEAAGPPPPPPAAVPAAPSAQLDRGVPRRALALVPAAVGVGVGAWAATRYATARWYHDQLTGPAPPATLDEGRSYADRGQTAYTQSLIGAAIAVAGLGAAVATFFLLGERSPAEVSLAAGPGVAVVQVGGRL